MSEPKHVDFGGAVGEFALAIGKKGAKALEIGYFPLVGDEEPAPGEPARWWAKVTMKGRVYTGESVGVGERSVLEALAQAATNAGLTVRLQFEE